MQFYSADQIDSLVIPIGCTVKLESLRQAVIPPYLMLMPFIKVPDGIVVESQLAIDEDGVHGCTYLLRAESPAAGVVVIGFRDMMTDAITHRRVIQLTTSQAQASQAACHSMP